MGALPTVDTAHYRDQLPCVLCGSTRSTDMHRQDPFRIVRCDCGMVFTLPRLSPEALHELYQEEYWNSSSAKDYGYTDYVGDAELYRRTFRLRSQVLHRHVKPPARVLDVGCAAGFCLEVLKEQGYDVHGLDISAAMAREAAGRVGADRVHQGPLEPSIFGGQHFDAITMWDVVEHVEDPAALLRTAREMLNPGGVVILETQNVASRWARLLGIRWQHYKFQEHLYHFDPDTIVTLLDQAGMERVEWSPRRGGKYVSFRFIAERAGRIHPLVAFFLQPLKLLGERALYLNFFDEMLVVARPRPESHDG